MHRSPWGMLVVAAVLSIWSSTAVRVDEEDENATAPSGSPSERELIKQLKKASSELSIKAAEKQANTVLTIDASRKAARASRVASKAKKDAERADAAADKAVDAEKAAIRQEKREAKREDDANDREAAAEHKYRAALETQEAARGALEASLPPAEQKQFEKLSIDKEFKDNVEKAREEKEQGKAGRSRLSPEEARTQIAVAKQREQEISKEIQQVKNDVQQSSSAAICKAKATIPLIKEKVQAQKEFDKDNKKEKDVRKREEVAREEYYLQLQRVDMRLKSPEEEGGESNVQVPVRNS